ncbi:SIMPL domain-containing protein [Actinoplanes sp. NPDC051513]|uniref:SIMPL domain-containing protein n=1 Tax=Actinoplanes sp. NPDC051513 TaxID=3363908 RepID=UPI0037995E1C
MQPTIVVRGEAVREVPPEIAVINVSVTARGKNKDAVLARLTEQSAVLRAELDAYGEAIERRETAGVQVYPDFKKSEYVGNVDTTVTVADFGALGEMLPRLAGMAQVSIFGPWWQLRRGSKAGAEVRRAAITDALDRAREYASAVGARIDKLVEISDEIAGAGGVVPIAARAMAFDAQRGPAPALELDPQRQTVQASVLVRVTITEPDLSEQSQ